MTIQKPRVIKRKLHTGEKIRHEGSIVFKTFVPDDVNVKAIGGSITLEQGGGNNLFLVAKAGTVVAEKPLGDSVSINAHGSTRLKDVGDDADIYIHGSDQLTGASFGLTGGNFGYNACLNVGGDIHVGNIGGRAHVRSRRGSFNAAALGPDGKYEAAQTATVARIGENTDLQAGKIVHAIDDSKQLGLPSP